MNIREAEFSFHFLALSRRPAEACPLDMLFYSSIHHA
jgi:hypothetical protein